MNASDNHNNETIISTKDLCVWYDDFQALIDVSMEIPEKSITALIGPSGCGKSTFLRTLNRMNDLIDCAKTTGNVYYRGQDIFQSSMEVSELRRHIGMVFQKPNPFPMSVRQYCLRSAHARHKESREIGRYRRAFTSKRGHLGGGA